MGVHSKTQRREQKDELVLEACNGKKKKKKFCRNVIRVRVVVNVGRELIQ